jgi:hypothetical protein
MGVESTIPGRVFWLAIVSSVGWQRSDALQRGIEICPPAIQAQRLSAHV